MPRRIRDPYLPPDPEAFRRAEPPTGRLIVIAPTRAACETIELAVQLRIETVLEREHGSEIRQLAGRRLGFGIVAGTGTGKTLAIRPIAEELLRAPLNVGVVNREREATPETPTWNVVIVTTGIARRWFQDELIDPHDTIVVDEIHQTSAELELCLALGKRVGCRFIWLSATVDPSFYAKYLDSVDVLETSAFDPQRAAKVEVSSKRPLEFLDSRFIRRIVADQRGVALFLPTRAEVEQVAAELGGRWGRLHTAFYHGGEPIRILRPYLEGTALKPFLLAMTQAGQSALNIHGLDTVVIEDALYNVVIDRGRNVLTRQHLGANEILQMAGRVHGRVTNGEVYLLTDRRVEFAALEPTAPSFQLAGDNERIALTAAALGVDLSDLDLPVPLDHHAYGAAVNRLAKRGLIDDGRLTSYGRDVEALPVDRPWAELIVHATAELIPFLAVVSNVNSLHHMTRDEHELGDLIVWGSDHLTAYAIYCEAVSRHGYVGHVYGLARHLFTEDMDEWAADRGVLVKVLEDIALGTASVYRTLELPLPDRLPRVTRRVLEAFRDLIAGVMPFDLVIDGQLAGGERVRCSRSSVCDWNQPIAGSVSYFADRYGVPRGAIEGTNLPFSLIHRHAARPPPRVEYRPGRGGGALVATRGTEFHGFELARERVKIAGSFPVAVAEAAREALVDALMAGATAHPNQAATLKAIRRLNEYWRRSGGTITSSNPAAVRRHLHDRLRAVQSLREFLEVTIDLSAEELVPAEQRQELDALPGSVLVGGDRVSLVYGLEGGEAVVELRLREGQARRLRERDLPVTDRPLRICVYRGRRELVRAASPDELIQRLRELPGGLTRRGRRRRRR